MRFSLSLKIFITFFILSFLSVTAMVFAIRYFSHSSFEKYVFQKEIDGLSETVNNMAEFYTENGGWDKLKNDRWLWRNILDPYGDGPESGTDRQRNHPPPEEGHPPPHGGRGQFDLKPGRHGSRREIIPRLSLFDAQKNLVIGRKARIEELSLIPIDIDGKTVGWLGLHHAPRMMHPLDQEFLEKQTFWIYLTGGLILFLSAPIAFLLARSFLVPIRKLTEATSLLAKREFDTRVKVNTSDELGQLALDFNSMAKTLGDFEERQQQWLADISHELLTPLAVLIGEIEAIQDGVRKPDTKNLESLHEETKRINNIVADLHTLSLAEAGTLPMKKMQVHPVKTLKKAVEIFKNRSEQNNMSVVTELEGGENIAITGDEDRLTQLYSNLFENALRYADKPGTITIRYLKKENALMISIEDSGPGVPESALPRLFDRLFRVDKSRSRETGGSGLGLSICQTIVKSHGGEILATIGESGGLRFEIEFPLL